MSELPKRTCDLTTDFATGAAETVITVETSPPITALAWVNFLEKRLRVLRLDYKHISADRIVVASTPHAAQSVARPLRSAAESADNYIKNARANVPAENTHNQAAARAAQRRAELEATAVRFGEP
jgi:hypothetical protein